MKTKHPVHINGDISLFIFPHGLRLNTEAQLAWAVEYTDCFSAEG